MISGRIKRKSGVFTGLAVFVFFVQMHVYMHGLLHHSIADQSRRCSLCESYQLPSVPPDTDVALTSSVSEFVEWADSCGGLTDPLYLFFFWGRGPPVLNI